VGRFISADPIGFAGGLNLWAYCDNDPVNAVDPLGLETLVFTGDRLNVLDDNGKLITSVPAFSGVAASDASSYKNPQAGPIPPGSYYVDPSENQYRTWNPLAWPWPSGYPPYEGDWGDRRIPIYREPGTPTYGRTGGYFIHGGVKIGSIGCIDIGPNNKWIIDMIGRSKKKKWPLLVDYSHWNGRVPYGPAGGVPWSDWTYGQRKRDMRPLSSGTKVRVRSHPDAEDRKKSK